jgi:hypothetical protein
MKAPAQDRRPTAANPQSGDDGTPHRREAVLNALKYADARTVEVSLAHEVPLPITS